MSSLVLDFSSLPFMPSRIFVGMSAGLDSCVLFDLLFHADVVREHGIELILVNVNHHTHVAEDELSRFVMMLGESYQVKVHVLHVQRECPPGASIEAFMREERYQLFNSLLAPNDIVVTGHHLDDQAETFLLNLMRGSGLNGLRGMSVLRKEGPGYLWRPLLKYSKEALLAYAHHHELAWRDDPTNIDLSLDRVFLRNQVLPLLHQRWPRAPNLLCRAADNIKTASMILSDYLQEDLTELIGDDGSLDLRGLKHFSLSKGVLLLKTYLDQLDYRLGMAQLHQIYQDFVLTDNDARPLFQYQGVALTRVNHKLYLKK